MGLTYALYIDVTVVDLGLLVGLLTGEQGLFLTLLLAFGILFVILGYEGKCLVIL